MPYQERQKARPLKGLQRMHPLSKIPAVLRCKIALGMNMKKHHLLDKVSTVCYHLPL